MLLLSLLSLALCAFASPLGRIGVPAGVPPYVLQYAPIVYLYSSDPYRPSDIGAQLVNTQPEIDFTVVNGSPNPLTLDNLNELNNIDGKTGTDVYLTSRDDVSKHPQWLNGVKPNSKGKTNGAISCAIIVNDHGDGIVDAFYMYFYAWDQGGMVLGANLGNHVGDWEHNMIRFQDGKPQALWYSQHDNGQAFEYDVVEKYKGIRPVCYSATGSHANYATTGTHAHDIPDVNLPNGIRKDYTDKGPLWDPTLSAYYYAYDATSQKFSAYDDSTPVNWLYFTGQWGDDTYPTSDPRQSCFLGIDTLCKYHAGPKGPEDKQLNRTNICPDNGVACIVRTQISI